MSPAELLRVHLGNFEVGEVMPASLLGSLSDELIRSWEVALERAATREGMPDETRCWLQAKLGELATQPGDELRALAAEVDAALRLSWLGPVARLPEGKEPTPDFEVNGLRVEVYCPHEHSHEREVVRAELQHHKARSTGPVKVAIAVSHPTTGSGRQVKNGEICRDRNNKALSYPSNKIMDRMFGNETKRSGKQFREGDANVLWLDLKHGWNLGTAECLPFRSIVAKGTCFTGMNGIWHGFYGRPRAPLFPERTALEYPLPIRSYPQQRSGWFREVQKVAAAIISVRDGVVLFENPWASHPFNRAQRDELLRLSELRPEFSWFGPHVGIEVEGVLGRMVVLAELNGQEASA